MHQLAEPWAKTNAEHETRSVFEHCFDVASVCRAILARDIGRRRLCVAFGVELTEVHLARLTVLAGLHDFGKALKGFQDKLDAQPGPSAGHVAEALAVLSAARETHAPLGIDLLRDWFDSPTDAIFVTICHHGEPVGDDKIRRHLATVRDLLECTAYGHEPIVEMRRLKERLLEAFPMALERTDRLAFPRAAQHLFAGILMAADWMASGFAFDPGDRRELAEALLNQTGWSGWHSGGAARDVLGGWSPRGAQAALETLPLDQLVVLEAPTGTGKTEAALIWANRLTEQGLVDGLYFAVPTRSAATELHARIGRVMAGQHPALKGKIVRAVPGLLDVDDARPDYPPETWAVAAPKRVFASPIAVGTIDQALLSIVRTRHAWLRAALLSRHLLVIDEVHASDPYMAALTNALVRRHLDLGGYVLAMSATLGETALAELQGRPRRSFQDAQQVPYPAIRGPNGDTSIRGAERRAIDVGLIAHDKAIDTAISAARDGDAVLLIRSTVADALDDFVRVSGKVDALLHHSRYALPDRSWLDRQLLGIFGLGGQRRGVIAVTTQTAEQSLDIDADLMITDACPADVLLQRFGRLHRHRHDTRPRAWIIDPGELDQFVTADGKVRGRKGQGWPWVYQNLLSVRQTLDWVRTKGEIIVPDHSRTLVERATHADHLRSIADEAGDKWQALWRRLYERARIDGQLAETGLVDWKRPYREALIDDRYATRLGEGAVTIATPGLASPFTGDAIDALPLPARWLSVAGPIDELPVAVTGNRVSVGDRAFTYTKLGVQRREKA